MRIPIGKFHKTEEELRKLQKKDETKLLELMKYMKKRNNKNIKRG